jgi:hypothetical protein
MAQRGSKPIRDIFIQDIVIALVVAVLAGVVVAIIVGEGRFAPVPIPPTPTEVQVNVATATAPLTVKVQATEPIGTITGMKVKTGQIVAFSADGEWCWGFCSTADGTPGRPSGPEECCAVLQGELFGKLIGRVGDWLFPIGSRATITMQKDSDLLLLMNDRIGTYGDNHGYLTVQITPQSNP